MGRAKRGKVLQSAGIASDYVHEALNALVERDTELFDSAIGALITILLTAEAIGQRKEVRGLEVVVSELWRMYHQTDWISIT